MPQSFTGNLLSMCQDGHEGLLRRGQPIAADDAAEALRGDAHGGDAGTEVADRHGGQPHVLPDQRDQLRIEFAAAVEPELRKLQPS